MTSTFQRSRSCAGYYVFRDLDVDRYDDRRPGAAGRPRGPRAEPSGHPDTTWEGRHLAYTHGYGVALRPGQPGPGDGSPDYLDTNQGGSPARCSPQPDVYFGEGLDGYSVVATERDEISFSNDRTSSPTRAPAA